MAASTRPVAAALFGMRMDPAMPMRFPGAVDPALLATARRSARWSALFNRSFGRPVTHA